MEPISEPIQVVPDGDTHRVQLTEHVASTYRLDEWAAGFSLMTAGYRDRIDPDDARSAEVPFNTVTVAIMAEARGRVLRRRLGTSEAHLHIGGEVRLHTQTFIQIAARIYAAHGIHVHLRREVRTCPIWYSSFAVFRGNYDGGDNFTASHSPYFKLGWKVLDSEGKQVTEEEADIIAEVQRIVAERAAIPLAPWPECDLIHHDLDVDAEYADYQRVALGPRVLQSITTAVSRGYRCAAYPLGGSMGATARRVLGHLEIPAGAVAYFLEDEDPRFHRVGEIGADNFGADVGKAEVCANTGAPARVLAGDADLALLWDPDGDRLNILTTAPVEAARRAAEFGILLGPDDGQKAVVYLSPNQLYLILAHYRIDLLREAGELGQYNWFVGTTFPTAMAIEELARQEGIPTIRVPVGFRNLGDLCKRIETNLGHEQVVETMIGERIPLGPQPRPLLLCEESGGAALGGHGLLHSRGDRRAMLALREKDGMQLALLAWAAAASMHRSGTTMAEQYTQIMETRGIRYRYNARLDVVLYDESLSGEELRQAKEEGVERRDRITGFFESLTSDMGRDREAEAAVRARLQKAATGTVAGAITPILRTAGIGDGTLIEMEDARLLVRASGTDALIRYYVDTTSPERLEALRQYTAAIAL